VTPSTQIHPCRRCLTLVSSMALILFLTCSAPAVALPLTVIPSSTTVVVGDVFSVNIGIADVVPDLFAYQLDVAFDATILRANSVSDGAFLTSTGGISLFGGALVLVLDNSTGMITILDSLQGPAPPATGASGSGVLATINFTAMAAGFSGIALSNVILEDSSGTLLSAETTDGRVEVTSATSVPEPGTCSLVVLGLACLWRKRRPASRNDTTV
jgi:hypothetical protein